MRIIFVFLLLIPFTSYGALTDAECKLKPSFDGVLTNVFQEGTSRYANFEECIYELSGVSVGTDDGTFYGRWSPIGAAREPGTGSGGGETGETGGNSGGGETGPTINPTDRYCSTFSLPSYTNKNIYDEDGNVIEVEKTPIDVYNTFIYQGDNYRRQGSCLYIKTSSAWEPVISKSVYDAFDDGKLGDCAFNSGFNLTPVVCNYQGETGGGTGETGGGTGETGGGTGETGGGTGETGGGTGGTGSSSDDGFDYDKMAQANKDALTENLDENELKDEITGTLDTSTSGIIDTFNNLTNSISGLIGNGGTVGTEFSESASYMSQIGTGDKSPLLDSFFSSDIFPSLPKASQCKPIIFGTGQIYEFTIDCKYLDMFKNIFAFILYFWTFVTVYDVFTSILRKNKW